MTFSTPTFPSPSNPGRGRRPLLAGLLLAALFFLIALVGDVRAQTGSDFAATDTALDTIRRQLDTTQKALAANPDKLADTELQSLRAGTLSARTQASDIADQLGPSLADLDARIAQLGTVAAGTKEDADVAAQRAQLAKDRNAADGQQRLARLLVVESQQLTAQLAALRRSEFQARLGERTDSVLSTRFWRTVVDDLPDDLNHLGGLGRELAASTGRTPVGVLIGAPLAAALACAALVWVTRRGLGWLQNRAPSGRLRRSLHALGMVLRWTLSFAIVAAALRAIVDWRETLPPTTAALLASVVGMIGFSGFVYGLLKALICADRPSWRLLPIPDPVATRLAPLPWLVTLTSLAAWVVERLSGFLNASLSTTVASNCLVALALGASVGVMLVRGERAWRRELARQGAGSRPIWLAGVAIAAWVLLAIAVISLLGGYVALGSFVVKQVVWSGIVVGAAYLLAALIDDLLMAWLAQAPEASEAATPAKAGATPSMPPARISAQFAVLASGLLRLALALLALMLLLAPFGEGPADLLRRSGQWQQSLAIGEFKLQPSAVLQALAVLVIGIGLVRLLRKWLTDRYLPTTSLDVGMQNSATSLFGYLGVVVAIAASMSAMGVGLERIAWVASALSVGIGFGLQAVVQNFVSGLILLAERPVKVGDWVSLGGIEGDIRRINVRATEIQQGDRSTVIVPNSEFITKTVRNVTLANPLGLVQLKLPLPITTDAERVRALLLTIFKANEDLVADPAPSVALDGIEGGQLVFNATGFVDSPRKSYNVRSALLFEVLKRFAAEGIELAKAPTMLLRSLPSASAGSGEQE